MTPKSEVSGTNGMKLSDLFSGNDGFTRPKTAFWWASHTYSNHLGLFSEDIDVESKRLLGNLPPGL